MRLCRVRNAFIKNSISTKPCKVVVRVAVWYLFFHETVERNFLLYSKAGVDDQPGVCMAEDSKAGRQAVALPSARHGMMEQIEWKVKVEKCVIGH